MGNRKKQAWGLSAVAAVVALVAAVSCGTSPQASTPPPPATAALPLTVVATVPVQVQEEVPVPASPTVTLPADPGFQQVVRQTQADLARRLAIDPGQIELVALEAVVWPDGGLGCPEPGMAYSQVRVEGLRIRLRAGKQIYSYHGGAGRPPFLCERATEDVAE